MFITPSFKKSLIVKQFQGNYLKWLHSFTPDDGPNPLDNACCRSMIECAKRTRSLPFSKKPPDADVVKSIVDRFGAEGASLKDLRIAALSSLAFAGFFRFNELANIQPNHIFFHEDFVKYSYEEVKQMCIGRGTMCISLS